MAAGVAHEISQPCPLGEIDKKEKKIFCLTWVNEDKLFLEISDNGPGVDEKFRDRIFDPFVTTKDPGKGMGLGLAIVHTIVNTLGGHISLQSSKCVDGASFKIEFTYS